MNKKIVIILVISLQFTICNLKAQSYSSKIYTTTIGTSAISINTLTAKTFSFNNLIYNLKIDTLSSQVFITTRKKDPSGKLYTNIGMFLAINANTDSLKWFNNTTQFDIDLDNDYLFASNSQKTSRYNKTYGYEQFQFPAKVIYTLQKSNAGLMYNPANNQELMCINLQDGNLKWKANIPPQQNINDIKYLNDTTLLIAANGLYALNTHTGLLWFKTLNTVQKNNKALVYSSVNNAKIKKEFNAITTSTIEAQITGLSSNIVVADTLIYFAGKQKLMCLTKSGTILWDTSLDENATSQMLLSKVNTDVVLLNTGIAQYNDFAVMYGKAFAMSVNALTGVQNYKNNSALVNLADYCTYKNDFIFANKTNIAQTNIETTALESIIEITEKQFGKFVEFIDGNTYFVEKEGFYVPLNFINDNVIYFRTDNDKVYGVAKNNVEYEYHFTELYKLNTTIGTNKLLSQGNKTIAISKNYELLFTFNINVPCFVFKNKIYFVQDQYLHIVNFNELK